MQRPIEKPAGTPVEDLDTPALIVDLDRLDANFAAVAGPSRAEVWVHKSPAILAMQMAAGGTVGGVCAAKVSEAEVFADAGADNVLIANQVVDADKIRRLAMLARRVETMVAVDAETQIERLAAGARAVGATLGVVIEIDTVMRRGGVRSIEHAVALARMVATTPDLRFRGVMSHQVPTVRAPSRDQRFVEGGRSIERVVEAKQAIEAVGIPVDVVSTGESWTYDVAASYPEVTEIEGGTYVVMEVPYAYMREFHLAARVMGRVYARPDTHTAIGDVPIDAIGAPNGLPTLEGFAGVAVTGIDHHGVVLSGEDVLRLEIGAHFFLLTHQQDVTMNRWDRYVGVRNGVVETIFEASARGCVH